MAKEAQSCCLISLSPYKQGTQVYTLGKWAETQPHSLSSLFLHSSLYTTQLHSFQCPSIPMYPIQALGVTQLWSSAPLVRFPRILTLLMQGPGGVSETSGRTLFEPFNLCLQRETTRGSRNRHLFPPRPQKSLCYFAPNLWIEPSGWKLPSMIILSVLLSWLLNYAPSILTKQEPSLVTTT